MQLSSQVQNAQLEKYTSETLLGQRKISVGPTANCAVGWSERKMTKLKLWHFRRSANQKPQRSSIAVHPFAHGNVMWIYPPFLGPASQKGLPVVLRMTLCSHTPNRLDVNDVDPRESQTDEIHPPANYLYKILEHVLQINCLFITHFACLGNWYSDSIEFRFPASDSLEGLF